MRSVINRLLPLVLVAQIVCRPTYALTRCGPLYERLSELPRSVVIYFARRAQRATESGSDSERTDFRQLFSPSGKVRRHLDTIYDAILDAHGAGGQNPDDIAKTLAQHLDLPIEWARSIVLYYDLDNFYRSHPTDAAKVIADSSLLGRPTLNKPETAVQALPSNWDAWFFAFSSQKRRFDAGREQRPFSPLFDEETADWMWFSPVYSRWFGIMAHTEENSPENVGAWVSEHRFRLLALWGYFVELENLGKSIERDALIPGAAIQVGGEQHADAWRYHWSNEGGHPRLVIDSFEESKASALGLERGQTQIQRFLRTLLASNAAKVFGQRIDGADIVIVTKQGPKTVDELRQMPELKQLLDPSLSYESFSALYEKIFPPELYRLRLCKGEKLPDGFVTVGIIAEGNNTRAELAEKYLQWLAYRLNRKKFGWAGGKVTPEELRGLLTTHGEFTPILVNGHGASIGQGGNGKTGIDVSGWDPTARLWYERNLLDAFPREIGGIPPITGFGSFTTDAERCVDNLAGHLPAQIQTQLRTTAPVKKLDGENGRQGRETSILRIARRLEQLVRRHNEWALEHGKTQIGSDLTTLEAVTRALDVLKQASLEARKTTDPQFAYDMAWLERKLLDSFPLQQPRRSPFHSANFSHETDRYFDERARHLPEAVQEDIRKTCPVSKQDGANAKQGAQTPTINIARRLQLLVRKHNEWARGQGKPLIDSDLMTQEGVAQALEVLKQASLEARKANDPQFSYAMAWLEENLINSFPREKAHQDKHDPSSSWSFSHQTDLYFDNLSRHLTTQTQAELRSTTPVKKGDGTRAKRGAETATIHIARRLQLLVSKHNEWAREQGTLPITSDLTKQEGVAQALETLKEASMKARKANDPQFAYEMAWLEKNLVSVFPLARRGPSQFLSGTFSESTGRNLDNLSRHLPDEVQAEIRTTTPVYDQDGARARQGAEAATFRIARRFQLLVSKHNAWARENGGTQIVGDLTSSDGVTTALEALKQVSLEARNTHDPQFAYDMAWLDDNLVDSFPRGQSGRSQSSFASFTNYTDRYFDDLARHLPTTVQEELRTNAPVNKNDGGSARKGGKISTLNIARRLQLVVQKHNEWAHEHGKTEITADLATPDGIQQALTILRQAALP